MAPKAKITREMILHTVLDITRESGFDAVNARSIARRLQCSTRPVFTCYDGMDALKRDFLLFAYAFYERFSEDFQQAAHPDPCLALPLAYLEFAARESRLFQLLFLSDMDLEMTRAGDFYRERGNEEKAERFSHQIGLAPEQDREVFLDLFFYTHGIAVLTASGKIAFDRATQANRLRGLLEALKNLQEVHHGPQPVSG